MNALSPIYVTESGIVIFYKLVHELNTLLDISSTERGITTLSKFLHSENACYPI